MLAPVFAVRFVGRVVGPSRSVALLPLPTDAGEFDAAIGGVRLVLTLPLPASGVGLLASADTGVAGCEPLVTAEGAAGSGVLVIITGSLPVFSAADHLSSAVGLLELTSLDVD